MKKLGKPLLYILVFIVLSSFIESTENITILNMQGSLDNIGDNAVNWLYELLPEDLFYDTYEWLLWDRGAELLSLTLILIFYLGVDKKVWKS